jgi:hypothetical protein
MRRLRRTAVVVLGILVLLYLGLVLGERMLFSGQVLTGVHLSGVSIDGLERNEVLSRLASHARRLERRPLELQVAGQPERLWPQSLGLRVDDQATTRAVLAAGRSGHVLSQAAGPVGRWIRPVQVAWRLSYNQQRLEAALARLAADVDEPPRNGDLRFDGAKVERVAARPGVQLDREGAGRLIAVALGDRPAGRLVLPVRRVDPPVNQPDVNSAATAAQRLLAKPIPIRAGNTRLVLTPPRLATALRAQPRNSALVLAIDAAALRAALGPALAKLERPPRDARFVLGSWMPTAWGVTFSRAGSPCSPASGPHRPPSPGRS